MISYGGGYKRIGYKYRFSIESNIPIDDKERLLMEAMVNKDMVVMLKSLGLPMIDEPTVIRDIIIETNSPLDSSERVEIVMNYIALNTEGFIRHSSWDLIDE